MSSSGRAPREDFIGYRLSAPQMTKIRVHTIEFVMCPNYKKEAVPIKNCIECGYHNGLYEATGYVDCKFIVNEEEHD